MTTQGDVDEIIDEEEIEDTRTVEEIEAEAKALESEIRELKKLKEVDELRFNQTRRLEKAKSKLEELKQGQKPPTDKKDVDVRDLITLGKLELSEDSEEAEILEKYKKAGLISDYKSGLENVAIKAEFEAIKAKNNAALIVDENDTDGYVKSKKEIISQYRKSGEVPADPKLQKDIALDNLKEMGL